MISIGTRQKVMEVARRLRYRHNLYASSLRSGKSQLVGLLALDLNPQIALAKIEALEREIREKGYHPLLRSAGGEAEIERECLKEFAGSMVEGLILVNPGLHVPEVLEVILDNHIPVVTLEPLGSNRLDCVTVDRRYGAYIATRHLLESGHRQIALMHGALKYSTVVQRLEGYRMALSEYGIRVEETVLVELIGEEGDYRSGYETAQHLLRLQPRPSALFCHNDQVAIGVMKAVREAGLQIPKDLAIIGFDNIDVAAYAAVPLTTVAQPVEEEARLAVDLLFQRIEKPDRRDPPRIIYVKPHLVVRESCGGAQRR